MVVVPLVSLAAVHDAAPAEVRLDAADAPRATTPSDDELSEERIAAFLEAERASRSAELATTTTEAPTTTAPPTTAAPTTTARPKPTTTTAKPTTTTAKPPSSTTSTMGPPPPCCRQEGGASYHEYADPRTCAHKSLPKGTALRVTNLANGKTTTCVVNDRGPYVEGRILDLSTAAFGEIANISDGVIRVAIEW
jgi:rare lipoprotein A